MAEWHHLPVSDRGNVVHERRHVIDPLRPGVNVTTLAWALAVTPQVDRKRPDAVLRHPFGEPLVPSGVLSEAVDDSEGDAGTRVRPRAVLQLDAAGRL
jgi:hypothetical protein